MVEEEVCINAAAMVIKQQHNRVTYTKASNKRTIRSVFFKITDTNSPFLSCAAKIISIDSLEKRVPV